LGLDGASSKAHLTETLISIVDFVSSSFIVMILKKERECICVEEKKDQGFELVVEKESCLVT